MPLVAVTVIVALPAATAVTLPFSLTVATLGSLLSQTNSGCKAYSGFNAAVSVSESPTAKEVDVLLRDTPVTGAEPMIRTYLAVAEVFPPAATGVALPPS